MVYRRYGSFFNRRYAGRYDPMRYRMVNRRYSRPATTIQRAARNMIATRRFNVVRRNPMAFVRRYNRLGSRWRSRKY